MSVILEAGMTNEELVEMISPIRNEDGTISHLAPFLFNDARIRKLIGENNIISKQTKRKIHFVAKKMVDSLNEMGFYQYLPDKLKPVVPLVLCMQIMLDEELIKILEDK